MREMICICCPLGCHLKVDDSDLNNLKVTGNTCIRGEKYARDEVICPKRVVTSIVNVLDGEIKVASCKTNDAIDKKLIFEVLNEIKKVSLVAPVRINDVVIKNVLNTGVDVIVTKNVERK